MSFVPPYGVTAAVPDEPIDPVVPLVRYDTPDPLMSSVPLTESCRPLLVDTPTDALIAMGASHAILVGVKLWLMVNGDARKSSYRWYTKLELP